MKKCIAIVAYGRNRVIGKNGDLPNWRLKEDMQHFKVLTTGGTVIMGRKTFDSFPDGFRPLPDRYNIVATKNPNFEPHPKNDKTYVVNNLISAIKAAYRISDIIYIIGGEQIYRSALEIGVVDEIIATEVGGDFDGDTYFPLLPPTEWTKISERSFQKNEKNTHNFNIVTYTKKRL